MPSAPPRHCPAGHPPYTGRRCPHCETKRKKALDAARPSAAARGYDMDWRRVRGAFLKAHPACCVCGQQATEADHITPISQGGARLSWSNLRPMCKAHHSQRTARDTIARGG